MHSKAEYPGVAPLSAVLSGLTRRLRVQLATEGGGRVGGLWLVALTGWMLMLIATPISIWVFGEAVFPPVATLGVVAQVTATLLALAVRWPLRRIMPVVLIVAIGSWSVELLGSRTGFPFGH